MGIKSFTLAGLLAVSFAGSASAGCEFNWHHYGDNAIRDLINREIGSHIPDKFCPLAAQYQIIVQSNAYTLRDMCAGHAIVSLRKKRSSAQQARTYSAIVTDTSCRSLTGARNLAAAASLDAIDDLITNLSDTVKGEIN